MISNERIKRSGIEQGGAELLGDNGEAGCRIKLGSKFGQSKKMISKQTFAGGKLSFVALRIVLQAEKQLR